MILHTRMDERVLGASERQIEAEKGLQGCNATVDGIDFFNLPDQRPSSQ